VEVYILTLRRNDYVSNDVIDNIYDFHGKRFDGVYCSKERAVQVQKYSSGHCILQERVEVPQGRQRQKHNLGPPENGLLKP
jgi:hypothetical protein